MLGVQRRHSIDDRRIVVVDAGKSTTRAAVFAGAALLARGITSGGLPHPETPGAQESILRSIDEALEPLGHGPYDTLVLAATGIRAMGTAESQTRTALAQRWACDVLVVNDVVAAYLGALGARPGILVEAGTGSLVLAVADGRTPVVLDGWGHLAGDRGSGFALGRAGLRAAFSALDGTGQPTSLTSLIAGDDPERTIRGLYAASSQTRRVAALAPLVLDAAADGDAVALETVEGVAAELVGLILTARRRLQVPPIAELPVATIGGLFESVLFRDAVERGLRAHIPPAHLLGGGGDALSGGRLLATTQHDPFTCLLISAFRNEEP